MASALQSPLDVDAGSLEQRDAARSQAATFKTLSPQQLERLITNCAARNFSVELHATAAAACERLTALIPAGADVSNGGSVTLQEIGFLPLLESGRHEWRYRRAEIKAEADEHRRQQLRRDATTVDYLVGSVNALTLNGEAICADYGGTRVGGYAYGARNVIWVVGTNKVVDSLEAGLTRLREVALPQEDRRTQSQWGIGSRIGKVLIVEHEPQPKRVRLLLVDQSLGF